MLVLAGATGHVGGAAASRLLAAGERIRVLVRDPAKGEPWEDRGAEVRVADLRDDEGLADALRGASGFLTLVPPDLASADFYGHQRRVAEATATAVRRSGVPHVVALSANGAELTEGTGFVRGLNLLETMLRDTEAGVTALRAAYHQDNVGAALGPALESGVFYNFLPPDLVIPMVAKRDVGGVAADALMQPGEHREIIDVLGPRYSMTEVVDRLSDAIGKPLTRIDIPQSGWVDALAGAGFSRHIAEVFAETYAAYAAGLFEPTGDRVVIGETEIDQVIGDLTRTSRVS